MKISKRTREQAALICAIAASSSRRNPVGTLGACDALGLQHEGPEEVLARAATVFALDYWRRWMGRRRRPFPAFAEAESMLRTGWCPP